MDIILLEKIDNVGGIGDRVKVKPGYARNFLLPQGKATLATPENIGKFEAIRAELEEKAAAELAAAEARAAKLRGQVLKITVLAGPEGKLFGSVGPIDIAAACEPFAADVERSEVRMPEGPIRVTGEHQVELHLHTDVNVEMTVVVESSEPSAAAVIEEDDDEDDRDNDNDNDND